MFMFDHPSKQWLTNVLQKMFDGEWLDNNVEDIVENLNIYIGEAKYILGAVAVLNYCMPNALEHKYFSELKDLYEYALHIFEEGQPIKYPSSKNEQIAKIFDETEHNGTTNITRYPDQYFMLKVNLSYTLLMMRDAKTARIHLLDVLDLIDAQDNPCNQVDAYCVILGYQSRGYQLPDHIDFDQIIRTTLQKASECQDKKLQAYLAINYYYYSQGKLGKLQGNDSKIKREIVKYIRELSVIKGITAEQQYYLAVIYREQSEFDLAHKHLDIASQRYAEVNNQERNVLILHEKALLYALIEREKKQQEKDWTLAKQWLGLAYKELEHVDNPFEKTALKVHLDHTQAHLHLYERKYNQAISAFTDTLPVWEERQDDYHLALTYNGIGYTYIKLENQPDALESLNQAKSICEGLDKEHAKKLLAIIDENITNAQNLY